MSNKNLILPFQFKKILEADSKTLTKRTSLLLLLYFTPYFKSMLHFAIMSRVVSRQNSKFKIAPN
jgi:hypothetical protein